METTMQEPLAWYIAGPGITLVMFSLLYLGRSFGMSANLRTMCSALGAGKKISFFDFDWRGQKWNLIFAFGTLSGGFISARFFKGNHAPQISEKTQSSLQELGFSSPESSLPPELFSDFLTDPKKLFLLIVGGLLVGFGSRWAGGCTSGHAISGLSQFQLPSLWAVCGFFAGGLAMTHLIFPLIF